MKVNVHRIIKQEREVNRMLQIQQFAHKMQRKQDGTRRSSDDGYASVCCDLDL